MNKYELIGIIETKKKELSRLQSKANEISEKIKRVLSDSWWEVDLKNAQWLKERADELLEIMNRRERIKKEIEVYKEFILEEV